MKKIVNVLLKKICFLLWLLILLGSCKESTKHKAMRIVKEWENRKVVFPANSVFTIQGKDTVDFSITRSDYKVVTYVDSTGCTSCKLQLPEWKRFMHEVDSMCGDNVQFLFYFHPKDVKELLYYFRRDKFMYPICLDMEDKFNKFNKMPDDMAFQTLLLNNENKVVAIGNPVNNPKVGEFYMQVLSDGKIVDNTQPFTKIQTEETSWDFGTFPKNQRQEKTFLIKNTGDRMLVIQKVVTSCGCVKVEYDKEPLKPGQTLGIKMVFRAEQAGRFNKNIQVHCNIAKSPLRFFISGNADSGEANLEDADSLTD